MGQLHRAPVVTHLARQHQLGAYDQIFLDVLGIEEGGGDLRSPLRERHDEVLPSRRPIGPANLGLLDLSNEGDVLALLGRIVILAAHRHTVAVLARVVAQQIVDGADAEDVIKCPGCLVAQDGVESIAQGHHGYSTPISRVSPRWPVR